MEEYKTDPGEFADEETVVLTDPSGETDFDDGVSAAFIRFDDMEEEKPVDPRE